MSIFTGWDTNASDDLTSSTTFSGDISGKYNNLQIKTGAVTTSEIANGAVTSAKLAEDYLKTSGGTLDGNLSVTGNIKIDGQFLVSNLKNFVYTNNNVTTSSDEEWSDICKWDYDDDIYWCKSIVTCKNTGDILMGCNGYYNQMCADASECDVLGVFPTDEDKDDIFETCNIYIGYDLPITVSHYLAVYATCLNVTED